MAGTRDAIGLDVAETCAAVRKANAQPAAHLSTQHVVCRSMKRGNNRAEAGIVTRPGDRVEASSSRRIGKQRAGAGARVYAMRMRVGIGLAERKGPTTWALALWAGETQWPQTSR